MASVNASTNMVDAAAISRRMNPPELSWCGLTNARAAVELPLNRDSAVSLFN
jgi:hypothetical protein